MQIIKEAKERLDQILTPAEARAVLKISGPTYNRLCLSGRIKAVDIGTNGRHYWRTTRRNIFAFIEGTTGE